MILLLVGFYEHIIDVHLHRFSKLFGEHTVDESLISCASILKTEWHHPVAVSAAVSYECSFLLIVGVHHVLIVPGECVLEGQEFVPCRRFDQTIDVWQWVAILWTCLIEIGKIDAHSPLSDFLFDNDWVSDQSGYPNSVMDPTLRSFSTSSLTTPARSGPNFRVFCLTGLKVGFS